MQFSREQSEQPSEFLHLSPRWRIQKDGKTEDLGNRYHMEDLEKAMLGKSHLYYDHPERQVGRVLSSPNLARGTSLEHSNSLKRS